MKKAQQKRHYVAKIDGRTVDCIEAPDLDSATKKLTKRWLRTIEGHANKHQRDVQFITELVRPRPTFPTLDAAGFATHKTV